MCQYLLVEFDYFSQTEIFLIHNRLSQIFNIRYNNYNNAEVRLIYIMFSDDDDISQMLSIS